MLLYFESEQFLTNDPKNASLKSRIFESADSKKIKSNGKQVLALVSSTLRYQQFLKDIIKHSKLLKPSGTTKIPKKLTPKLSLLLVHDLLLTKSGRIQSAKHPIKDYVLAHKTRIHSEFIKLKLKHKVKDLSELVKDDQEDDNNRDYTPVRWVRVNTIKSTVDAVLTKDPFFKKLTKVDAFEKVIDTPGTIFHDPYIPNLYGLHPKDKVTSTDAYKQGKIIIQDRASCFPAHILHPSPGDHIIDACAAPGNKTTHAASYVKNQKHSIVAFERNSARSQILRKMVARAGASKCISVKNQDFTTASPKEFNDVVGFIVDPSCSGSGIFGRSKDDKLNKNQPEKKTSEKTTTNEEEDIVEENDDDDEEEEEEEEEPISGKDKERLAKLSSFQFTIVKHALSFPSAKKLVYSTCSIHAEENEQVVIDLLNDGQIKNAGWRLCTRDQVIPDWPRRGWSDEFVKARFGEQESKALAEGCIRSLPKVDGGIGFFAAAFERD
ncbi:rRNA (cytosine-C5-)-methyltransferase [Saccharomycopsis crataegensis]|uniref:rRNA (Cytosine-C5-)-methyltransferase n=1 Tax=Saccharomycopsis crataegensis TaxID=43959 RepID=A0AAV5QTU8_9ASCO|nr:rRNA (cytosine-C5-)-methyltransferase [Saccharomycopsis crataegensis]